MFRHLLLVATIAAVLATALICTHLPGKPTEFAAARKEVESLWHQRLALLKPYIEKAFVNAGQSVDIRNLSDAFKAATSGSSDRAREGALDSALAKLVANPDIYPKLLADREFLAMHHKLDRNEFLLARALVRVRIAANTQRLHNSGILHRIARLITPAIREPALASGPAGDVAIVTAKGNRLPELYSVAME